MLTFACHLSIYDLLCGMTTILRTFATHLTYDLFIYELLHTIIWCAIFGPIPSSSNDIVLTNVCHTIVCITNFCIRPFDVRYFAVYQSFSHELSLTNIWHTILSLTNFRLPSFGVRSFALHQHFLMNICLRTLGIRTFDL